MSYISQSYFEFLFFANFFFFLGSIIFKIEFFYKLYGSKSSVFMAGGDEDDKINIYLRNFHATLCFYVIKW